MSYQNIIEENYLFFFSIPSFSFFIFNFLLVSYYLLLFFTFIP